MNTVGHWLGGFVIAWVLVAAYAPAGGAAAAQDSGFRVVVGSGENQSVGRDGHLLLSVPDHEGSYRVPYIQSARDLPVKAIAGGSALTRVRFDLYRAGKKVASLRARPPSLSVRFSSLSPGEYAITASRLDAGGKVLGEAHLRRIGVGVVVAALGDSITEGYWGRRTKVDLDGLTADRFPTSMVSRDGRNFPQFSPTALRYAPDCNVQQSWLTELNDQLSASLGYPVFFANEGWGGITTGQYLSLMKTNANWQARMRLLKPSFWLIHLGVNDERGKVPTQQVADNLSAMVRILCQQYGAAPRRILVAKPCYDYAEGAEPILKSYCKRIDELVEKEGLSPGPDFYTAYARDRRKWYGADPVHPNVAGMTRMAELWYQAILSALPKDEKKP